MKMEHGTNGKRKLGKNRKSFRAFFYGGFAATKRGAAVETTAPLITLIEFVIITVGQRIPVLYLLHCLRI